MAAAQARVVVDCGPSAAGRLERETDDQLVDVVAVDDRPERRRVGVETRRPPDGGQRPGRRTVPIGQRETDPPLAEIDAEQPRHDGETDGPGVSTGTEPSIEMLTRLSIVGIVSDPVRPCADGHVAVGGEGRPGVGDRLAHHQLLERLRIEDGDLLPGGRGGEADDLPADRGRAHGRP